MWYLHSSYCVQRIKTSKFFESQIGVSRTPVRKKSISGNPSLTLLRHEKPR